MTRDRLKQAESLVCELEEERERFAREARHRKRIEETYGVGCLFGEQAFDNARERLDRIEAQCQDERDTVRQWIDSVSDSMTRRALRLRYLDRVRETDGVCGRERSEEAGREIMV